jgi:hypothetical protein
MSLLYTPCPNKTTEIMVGHAIIQFIDGCGYSNADAPEDFPKWEAQEVKEYYDGMVEDLPDHYDEDWFSIVATPNISKAVDWRWIAEHITYWYTIYDTDDGTSLFRAWVKNESEEERKERMEREAHYTANGLEL